MLKHYQTSEMEQEKDLKHLNIQPSVSLSSRDLRASSLGWDLALPIVAGPVIGYFIDKHYLTGHAFTLSLLGLGIIIGTYNLIKFIESDYWLGRAQELMNKELNNEPDP